MATKSLETASFHFSVRIAKLAQTLQNDRKETVMSRKVLESGTAIGFLISEAEREADSEDYTDTMNSAFKEANRTLYWLKIIEGTGWIPETLSFGLKSDCEKLIERIQLAKAGINT